MTDADGKPLHAEVRIGDSTIMIGQPAAQFYGDINAGVEDPLGNWWWIATHVEDVSAEEVMRRSAELKR